MMSLPMTKTKDGGMTNDETANSDESTDQAVEADDPTPAPGDSEDTEPSPTPTGGEPSPSSGVEPTNGPGGQPSLTDGGEGLTLVPAGGQPSSQEPTFDPDREIPDGGDRSFAPIVTIPGLVGFVARIATALFVD